MLQLILILHVLVALSIIALVLIQHGKGADMGASFGSGASQTLFGSAGAVPFLMKVTAVLAAIFFMTSIGLGYMTSRAQRHSNAIQNPASSTIMISKPIVPKKPAPSASQPSQEKKRGDSE